MANIAFFLLLMTAVMQQSVTTGFVQGIAVDMANGEPLSGTAIYLMGSDADGRRFTRQIVTDDKGRFALDNLEAGRYQGLLPGQDTSAPRFLLLTLSLPDDTAGPSL